MLAFGQVINRGESIDNIAATSDELQSTSMSFRDSATKLKRQAQCDRIKSYVCIALIVAVGSLAVAMYICGVKLDQC